MARYVTATFPDGSIFKRGSQTKHYTHAYKYIATNPAAQPKPWVRFGASSSEQQCRSNLAAETAWLRKNGYTIEEYVVAVTEITAKEFIAIKAGE